MEKNAAKRIRAANWDLCNKVLLRELIEDKISIIENKCVDTNTSRLKRDAWREITTSFNNMSATSRETSQLQAQWRGTKMKAKATASTYKKSLNATGGGSKPKSPDPELEKIMALIPHEFEEGESNFDSDAQRRRQNFSSQRTDGQLKENIPNEDTMVSLDDYEDVEVLHNWCEEFSPSAALPPHLPPASPSPLGNSKKQNKQIKTDEQNKQELFNIAMQNRRAEKTFMEIEHKEKVQTILMERIERLKTLEMERTERKLTLELERQQKAELHRLRMKRLEEYESHDSIL